MSFGLCIVGCGQYTDLFMSNIKGIPEGVDLFFASLNIDLSKKFCDKYGGVGYFGDTESAAKDPRVNAMYFITPHNVHLENVALAARFKKDILLEKPIARNLDEGKQIAEIVRNSDVKCMIAENNRFNPTILKAKQLISSGVIGDMRILHINWVNREIEFFKEWTWRNSLEKCGGGRFIDGGIHCVDLLVNMIGLPSTVFALSSISSISELEGEDSITLLCKNSSGVIGLINYCDASPTGNRKTSAKIQGTTGELKFKLGDPNFVISRLDEDEVIYSNPEQGITETFEEFLKCSREGKKVEMDCEQGLNDLAIVMAAYESSKTSTAVNMEYSF